MTYRKILTCICFLLFSLFLFGQATQKEDTLRMLSQHWKIEELYHHQFKADEKEELENFIQTTRFHFNKDGSFLTKADTVSMRGKWQFNAGMITIQMEDGDSFRMKIIALSPTLLNFESRPLNSETISSAGRLVPIRE